VLLTLDGKCRRFQTKSSLSEIEMCSTANIFILSNFYQEIYLAGSRFFKSVIQGKEAHLKEEIC
jgi:hypothetical protein